MFGGYEEAHRALPSNLRILEDITRASPAKQVVSARSMVLAGVVAITAFVTCLLLQGVVREAFMRGAFRVVGIVI